MLAFNIVRIGRTGSAQPLLFVLRTGVGSPSSPSSSVLALVSDPTAPCRPVPSARKIEWTGLCRVGCCGHARGVFPRNRAYPFARFMACLVVEIFLVLQSSWRHALLPIKNRFVVYNSGPSHDAAIPNSQKNQPCHGFIVPDPGNHTSQPSQQRQPFI